MYELWTYASPELSSGQAMAAIEEVAAQVLPSGMGDAWSDMSYQEKKATGGQAMVFGMSLLFVFPIIACTPDLSTAYQTKTPIVA
jgi:HAE1 family hydrophobic/amphiphilic exporter-1